jgi:acyl dehydratase
MIKAGDRFSTSRTFTDADVATFAALTGDRGRHHVERDARGRLMVHGLLVAAVPTKLGGDLHYIAREMTFEFVRPVFTGDTVDCELAIVEAAPAADRLEVRMEVVCRNQDGMDVIRGASRGIILLATA